MDQRTLHPAADNAEARKPDTKKVELSADVLAAQDAFELPDRELLEPLTIVAPT